MNMVLKELPTLNFERVETKIKINQGVGSGGHFNAEMWRAKVPGGWLYVYKWGLAYVPDPEALEETKTYTEVN